MSPKTCFLSTRVVGLSFLMVLALPLQAGQWDLGDSAIAQLEDYKEGMAAFKIGGNWGFVDRAGKVAIEPQYDEVTSFSDGMAAVSRDDKWGFIDKMGKLRVPIKYCCVREFSQGLAGAEDEGGKWGYLAPDGHWALPPQFRSAESFQGGFALVQELVGGYLLIDKAGNVIKRFSPEFDVARKSGILVVTRKPLPVLVTVDGKVSPLPAAVDKLNESADPEVSSQLLDDNLLYGAKDRDGNWVVAPTFVHLEAFKDGLAIAGSEGALGLIDRTGKFIVQPVYKEIKDIAGGRYLAHGETPSVHRAIFDRQGRRLFSDACARLDVQKRGSWTVFEGCQSVGVMDREEKMYRFAYGQPEIAGAGDYLLIQSTAGKLVDGRLMTPFTLLGPQGVVLSSEAPEIGGQYDWAMLIEGGEAGSDPAHLLPLAMLVGRDGGVAIVTRDHRIVRRPEWRYDQTLLEYSQASEGLNGPMIMKAGDAWGAIDAQGEWLVQPTFEHLHAFAKDVAQATKGGQEIVIGRSGKHRELPAGFRLIERSGAERFVLEGRGEAREIQRIEHDLATGEERRYVVDSRFEGEARAGLAPAYENGKWGMIDAAGKWVVAPSFENRPEALMWNAKLIAWKTYRYEKAEGGQSLYGLLSPAGKEIIKPGFRSITLHEQTGLFETSSRHGQDGLMRADGQEVLPAVYQNIRYRDNGGFEAEPVEQKGLMSLRGEWILEPGPYQFNDLDRRPYSREKLGEKEAYIDIAGRISTPARPLASLDDNPDYWDRREETDRSGKTWQVFFGFDWKPRIRLPKDADKDFSAGFLDFQEYVKGGYRTRLADHRGKLLSLDYDSVGRLSDGLAVVKRSKGQDEAGARYGYIDRQGKTRIAPNYERAEDFSDGRAVVVHQGNYGVIDNQGRLILHSAWLCGQYPVLLDGKEQIIWPTSGLQECRSLVEKK